MVDVKSKFRGIFLCGSFCYNFVSWLEAKGLSCVLSVFLTSMWSPVGKGLISWLSCMCCFPLSCAGAILKNRSVC